MSTYYQPHKGTAQTYSKLLALDINKDGVRLARLRPVKKEFVETPIGRFNHRSQYALTDGVNWLHIDFTPKTRRVSSAQRYGLNYVTSLLEFCGDMKSEHDA